MSAPCTEMLAPSWQRERDAWVTDAACVGADPELWFPAPNASNTLARRICGECPVRRECLAFSDSQEPTRDNHGIWGGLTPKQRATRRKALGIIQPRRAESTAEKIVPTGTCRNGHVRSPDTTYFAPRNGRFYPTCKICRRNVMEKQRQKQKEQSK